MTGEWHKIVGERMSSVEFVQDYLQLRFEGHCISVYSSLAVEIAKDILLFGDENFPAALVALINSVVTDIVENVDKLIFAFGDQAKIVVNLSANDRRMEAAALCRFADGSWRLI